MTSWKSLIAIAALVPFAKGLLRYPCGQLTTAPFEDSSPSSGPIVSRGHLHQIAGGNGFDAKNISIPAFPSCTTCRFKEDNSNYWTSLLSFKHPNGTLSPVPIGSPPFTGSYEAGLAVYYLQQPLGDASARVSAFPKGFRLNVGNPAQRTNTATPGSPEAYALTHRCWNEGFPGDDPEYPHAGTGPLDTIALPNRPCPGGIRSQIFFPSCWNGRDLDSVDHASHVVYHKGTVARDGLFFTTGRCPDSHPVRLPVLYLEVFWDTRKFNSIFPSTGQPFVYSNGDNTGYSRHAGFIAGWETATLQKALDQCTNIGGDPYSCRVLTTQNDAQIDECQPKRFPIPL